MKLPGSEEAVIDVAKLRDYLLSMSHPIGRFKAAFFGTLGYTSENWHLLDRDLRAQHLTQDAQMREETEYGRKYEIRATLEGPSGKSAEVVSVWIVLHGEDVPRFVTAYAGARQ